MKKGEDIFGVTMGAYDGAEVCELIGIFLLFQLSELFNRINLGLYRDDGLGVLENKSGPQSEKIKKIINIYQKQSRGDSQNYHQMKKYLNNPPAL